MTGVFFVQKVILIGSPNVGKSVLFHRLTGQLVTISNYPGTTIELTKGICQFNSKKLEIVDTPGMYSLYPISKEEDVTKKLLNDAGMRWVVHVVDAKNLERMLPLTIQLIQLGFPVILAVNMLDEATKLGIIINLEKLASLLNIPVVGTVGTRDIGITELIKKIFANPYLQAKKNSVPQSIDYHQLHMLAEEARYLTKYVTTVGKPTTPWSLLDKVLLTPISGLPIALLILYLVFYKLVGQFGAGLLVDFLDQKAFQPILIPICEKLALLIPSQPLQQLLIGDFGIITLGIRYAFVIILPIIGVFFFVFSFLEDSGYLPRLAFLLDRSLKTIGLSGRGIIPLVLGLGCGTMATAVTRTLETERERKIATFLLALTIPCSAQLGLIITVLTVNPKAFLIWLVTISIVFLWSGTLLNQLYPGAKPVFYLELPPLRVPHLSNSLLKTLARMTWYFWEILPMFVLTSIAIWLGELAGIFPKIIAGIEYLVTIVGLPKETAVSFLLGFLRRDYGAAGIYDLQAVLTWQQLTIACTILTLFIPCLAQFTVIIRERGLLWASITLVSIIAIAFFVGLLLEWLII